MKTTTKFAMALLVLIVAAVTVVSEFVSVRLVETTLQGAGHTANVGEVLGDVVVGQTFVAQKGNLSGVAVMFATYSGRENTQLVEFHLRELTSPALADGVSAQDVRTVSVSARGLRDNQFHRFEFEPIADSQGKNYFFFVASPTSTPGNAITVDVNGRDPYPRGVAVTGRGVPIEGVALATAGRPELDVVFETYHTVSAREAAWTRANGYVQTFIATWDQRQSTYWLWGKLLLPAVGFVLVVLMLRRFNWGVGVWMGLLFVLAFVMRLWYANNLPVTVDEGNYLYDAWSLLSGKLAGGDGYVKSPLVVAWIAVWEFIFRNTIMAGRLSSVVAGALTLFPVYALSRDLFGQRAGLVSAAAWALFGPAVVFNIYVHTQPVAVFLAVSGLAVLLMALRGSTPRFTPGPIGGIRVKAAGTVWFVLAGVLLGLGVASRKSVLALGLVPVLMVAVYGRGIRPRLQHLIAVGVGFAIVMALFLGLATLLYGPEGFWEALGANSAEDGINVAEEDAELIRAYSIRGMTPFFRESMALIWLSLLGLGIAGERAVRSIFQYLSQQPGRGVMQLIDYVLPKLGWLLALVAFAWAWSFFREYEGVAFHILGIPWLWGVMGVGLLVAALLPRLSEDRLQLPEQQDVVPKSTQPDSVVMQHDFWEKLAAWVVGPVWVLGLVVFYTNWIKFHANYIAEFIPPLVLLVGPGVLYLFDRLRAPLFLASDYPPLAVLRKLLVGVTVVVLVWALGTSSYITFVFEHTGTFDRRSAVEAAAWARRNIPSEQPIFTGAALIPYLSGHHTALDIAHPRWYTYEFTRKDTQRLNTFLPSAEEMVAAFREAEWFLKEQQTAFSFLMEYDEIVRGLETDFVPVQEIENGNNTLTFYKRVRRSE